MEWKEECGGLHTELLPSFLQSEVGFVEVTGSRVCHSGVKMYLNVFSVVLGVDNGSPTLGVGSIIFCFQCAYTLGATEGRVGKRLPVLLSPCCFLPTTSRAVSPLQAPWLPCFETNQL